MSISSAGIKFENHLKVAKKKWKVVGLGEAIQITI